MWFHTHIKTSHHNVFQFIHIKIFFKEKKNNENMNLNLNFKFWILKSLFFCSLLRLEYQFINFLHLSLYKKFTFTPSLSLSTFSSTFEIYFFSLSEPLVFTGKPKIRHHNCTTASSTKIFVLLLAPNMTRVYSFFCVLFFYFSRVNVSLQFMTGM